MAQKSLRVCLLMSFFPSKKTLLTSDYEKLKKSFFCCFFEAAILTELCVAVEEKSHHIFFPIPFIHCHFERKTKQCVFREFEDHTFYYDIEEGCLPWYARYHFLS